jgi:hypothetical protein
VDVRLQGVQVSNDKVAATFHGAEPSRERVEVYEKALGCRPDPYVTHPRPPFCQLHDQTLLALGCPVAVAAARVEADETAALRQACDEFENAYVGEHEDRVRAEAEVDRLTRLISHIKIDN